MKIKDKEDNKFPDGFLWGASTSAYQIEGAVDEDGREESVWDRFEDQPGKVQGGDKADIACDHYHRYKEDIRLMAELGLKAYRFSLSWPRIQPEGKGRPNPRGLDFYDRLVDELLKNGILPFPTLYHWDHPQALEDAGGWRSRDFVHAFADYAAVAARRLGDRVGHWITLNEPPCIATLGYENGWHAPGAQEPPAVVDRVRHHVLLANGLAALSLRQESRRKAEVGIAHNPDVKIPKTGSAADLAAAKTAFHAANGWWFDPLFKGEYPADQWRRRGADVPEVRDGDMKIISTPLDFFGLNVYSGAWVEADAAPGSAGFRDVPCPDDHPKTEMGWNVLPEAVYYGARFMDELYKPSKIYITESGCAFPDELTVDGRVRDPRRIDYLERHVGQALRALRDGVPVGAYFVWSLLDNFEWAYGFSKRFGLVYVDYPTLRRIPKDSARWYADVVRRNGL